MRSLFLASIFLTAAFIKVDGQPLLTAYNNLPGKSLAVDPFAADSESSSTFDTWSDIREISLASTHSSSTMGASLNTNWSENFKEELLDAVFEAGSAAWQAEISEAAHGVGSPIQNTISTPSHKVLPVQLQNWGAKAMDDKVLLAWTTTIENNNQYFTVERSDDAVNWTTLKVVQGEGTKEHRTQYELQDESPLPAANYYRLSQTGYDGATETYDVRLVKLNMSVFPSSNLEQNKETIEIKLSDVLYDLLYEIVLYDSNGGPVKADIRQEAGDILVDASSLSTGYYFVKVAVGDYSQDIKVFVN